MDQGPLVSEQIDAGAKLVREFNAEYKPLRAAFWLKDYDTGRWRLILASDQIDDSNARLADREVDRLLAHEPLLWLDPLQVRFWNIDDRVVRDILDIQRQYPRILPAQLQLIRLGGELFQEAYIYALPSLTAEQPASR